MPGGELFSYWGDSSVRAATLLVTLGSFADTGHVQRILDDHLRQPDEQLIGQFDADQITSYREQRPVVVFDKDHYTNYQPHEFALRLLTDTHGHSFLLLNGPEPGLAWERVAVEIESLVCRHDVEQTIMLSSIPMPVPHTRKVLVTRYASRSEILHDHRPMFGTVNLPATFPSLLTVRLAEAGHDVIGLAAHVPHYLADHDFPTAAIALLDVLSDYADLTFDADPLREAAGVVLAQLDQQVEDSEEVAEHVAVLERQYDEFVRQHQQELDLGDLPSADEIGQAAEEFLKRFDGGEPRWDGWGQ